MWAGDVNGYKFNQSGGQKIEDSSLHSFSHVLRAIKRKMSSSTKYRRPLSWILRK